MTEEAYKIWRVGQGTEHHLVYLGEFHTPNGQPTFYWHDLVKMGFQPGRYLVRVPTAIRKKYIVPPWQDVVVPE